MNRILCIRSCNRSGYVKQSTYSKNCVASSLGYCCALHATQPLDNRNFSGEAFGCEGMSALTYFREGLSANCKLCFLSGAHNIGKE